MYNMLKIEFQNPPRLRPPRGGPNREHAICDDIASYFFLEKQGSLLSHPCPLSSGRPPRALYRLQNAARIMPPHISHPPIQNCINRRDATQHFTSLVQVLKLTTSCPWYLLSSNALLKSKGKRMATNLSRHGLKIPRMYILDLTFTNMYRITGERKACG